MSISSVDSSQSDRLRILSETAKELAHYLDMEDEFLRTMYFAGRRGEEIKQEWRDGQAHASNMIKDYRHDLSIILRRFPK